VAKGTAVRAPVRRFTGVPGFFRRCCPEAARAGAAPNYGAAAYQLCRRLAELVPYGVGEGEWLEELEGLAEALEPETGAPDDDGVWRWFQEHFPRCLALVPPGGRPPFLAGVHRAVREEVLGL
jgi:hypothetical protein